MAELKFSVELELKKLQEQQQKAIKLISQIGEQAKTSAKDAATATTQATQGLEKSLHGVASMAKRAFAGIASAQLINQIVAVRTQMDSLERSFVSLTQSAEKGQALTAWIKDFAASTPLSVQALAGATQTMLGFGLSADEAQKYLRAIGNISMGNAEKLQSLSLAFSQMSATGKLMGQDLLQMINAGFNPLTEIARKTGKSVGELKENLGAIPLKEVQEAFVSVTQAGGLFNGMLEKQAEGLAGLQAKLRGTITDGLNKIGEENEGTIKAGLKLAEGLIKGVSKLTPLIMDAVVAFGAYKTALVLTATAEKAVAAAKALHATRTTNLVRAQVALNKAIKANPYAIATAALTALVFAVYKFATAKSAAEKANEAFAKSLEKENQLLKERRQKGEDAIATIQDETRSHLEQVQALDELRKLYPAIFEGMDLKQAKTLSQLDAQRQLNDADKESILLSAQKDVERLRSEQARYREQVQTSMAGGAPDLYASGKLKSVNEELKLAEAHLKKVEAQAQKAEAETAKASTKTVREQVKEYTAQIKEKKQAIQELRQATATADTQKIEALQKEIKGLEEKRDLLTGASDKGRGGTTKPKDKTATEREREELEARRAYQDLLTQQIASTIATLQNGTQKELQQIEESHRLKLQAIERQEEDLRLARQEQGKSITEDEVKRFQALKEQEKQLLQQAIASRLEEERKANEDTLADYLSYLQRRERIQEESRAKEEQIKRSASAIGVDPESYIQELEKQTSEALTALDIATAEKQASFKQWLTTLADLSLEELQKALTEAKARLQQLQQAGTATGDQLAQAFAQVAKLETAIATAQAEQATTADETTTKWTDLQKVLHDTTSTFSDLGKEIGGVAGEALQTAGAIATSTTQVINGIVTLSKASQTAIKGTAHAVETASVILAIISAVFQIGQKIASLFNTDKQKDEQIKALQGQIDSLQWELQTAQRLQNLSFDRSGAVIATYGRKLVETHKALQQANKLSIDTLAAQQGVFTALLTYSEQRHQQFAKAIATSYKEMDYSVTKALGEDKFKGIAKQIDNIAEQTANLQRQREAEESKKKSDGNAIKKYEEQIQENALKAREIIDKATEDIMGGSAKSIAQKLGDALIEAFKKGEDGAKAWGDTVKSIVSDIIKRMLITKLVEQPIGRIFDKYQKQWFDDNTNFRGVDIVMKSIPTLSKELENAGVGMMEALKNISPALEGILKIADTTEEAKDTRTAERKGIATASQDSVDELNGRATAIQSHTYTIQEQTRELKALTSNILQEVKSIRTNTDTLHDIKRDIKGMNESINAIQTKGVKTL